MCIRDRLTIFGGFAPNSTSAEVLSKALGSRTVMSGSVGRSTNDPSHSCLLYTSSEVAEAEGVDESAVRRAVERGLENMKKYLKKSR